MRAVVITAPGGPEVLRLADLPDPVPGRSEIRVRVAAAGVNRADLLQRAGGYAAPPGSLAQVPGLEYAGVVDALGEGVTAWREGDRVMGLVGGGGYADYVITHEAEALPVPFALTLEHAAGVPEVFMTAYDAMVTQIRIRRGERLLIHAVGSGVGTAAVQLARALGVETFGTARSAWKLERALGFGLDHAIDPSAEDFAAEVDRHTGGGGVDGILDLVGGDYLAGNVRALAPRGRLVIVGLVAGARAPLDMALVLRKRLTIRGTVMRTRSLAEKIEVAAAFRSDVLPLLAEGAVQPVIDTVLPVEDAARAHELVGANLVFGKVVLRL
jgi:putative PIG3 family NAD(P)H quinone oxidoreductase